MLLELDLCTFTDFLLPHEPLPLQFPDLFYFLDPQQDPIFLGLKVSSKSFSNSGNISVFAIPLFTNLIIFGFSKAAAILSLSLIYLLTYIYFYLK